MVREGWEAYPSVDGTRTLGPARSAREAAEPLGPGRVCNCGILACPSQLRGMAVSQMTPVTVDEDNRNWSAQREAIWRQGTTRSSLSARATSSDSPALRSIRTYIQDTPVQLSPARCRFLVPTECLIRPSCFVDRVSQGAPTASRPGGEGRGDFTISECRSSLAFAGCPGHATRAPSTVRSDATSRHRPPHRQMC